MRKDKLDDIFKRIVCLRRSFEETWKYFFVWQSSQFLQTTYREHENWTAWSHKRSKSSIRSENYYFSICIRFRLCLGPTYMKRQKRFCEIFRFKKIFANLLTNSGRGHVYFALWNRISSRKRKFSSTLFIRDPGRTCWSKCRGRKSIETVPLNVIA